LGIVEVNKSGFGMDTNVGYPALLLLLPAIAINTWLLTVTFFPLIIINEKGIKAVSLFWQRTLLWADIKAVRLLKVDIIMKGTSSWSVKPHVNTSFTPEPVKSRGLGKRTITYIVVADKPLTIPKQQSVQIFSHNKIAAKGSIAFEFELKAWQHIREKLNQMYN